MRKKCPTTVPLIIWSRIHAHTCGKTGNISIATTARLTPIAMLARGWKRAIIRVYAGPPNIFGRAQMDVTTAIRNALVWRADRFATSVGDKIAYAVDTQQLLIMTAATTCHGRQRSSETMLALLTVTFATRDVQTCQLVPLHIPHPYSAVPPSRDESIAIYPTHSRDARNAVAHTCPHLTEVLPYLNDRIIPRGRPSVPIRRNR